MADTHITIGDVSPRIQYTGDGTQTAFPFPFPIFAPENLTVYLDDAQATTGYTVTGAGNSAGGTVTFDTAPANGVRVTLIRSLSIQRVTDFQQGGAFRAKVVNDEMDYLTAALQQLQEALRRAPMLGPATAAALPIVVPEPKDGATLRWNGGRLENGPTIDEAAAEIGVAVQEYSAAAAASALDAAAYADRAHAWAETPEGSEVSAGQFSARHYAEEARKHASGVSQEFDFHALRVVDGRLEWAHGETVIVAADYDETLILTKSATFVVREDGHLEGTI